MWFLTANLIQAEATWDGLFSARNLGIALWVGLALLTISLLVVMRTRWGQAKPISKCVALSVLGHVLLGGYAYGTRLIFEVPPQSAGDTVQVKMVSAANEPATSESNAEPAKPSDWQVLPTEPIELPDAEEIAKPDQRNDWDAPSIQRRSAEIQRVPSERHLQQAAKPIAIAPSKATPHPPRRNSSASVVKASQISIERNRPQQSGANSDFEIAEVQRPRPAASDRLEIHRDPADVNTEIQQNAVESFLKETNQEARTNRSDLESNSMQAVERRISEMARFRPANRTTDQPPPTRQASAQRRLADGEALPKLYSLRAIDGRLEIAKRRGGSRQSEQAVDAALAWLAKNQEANGSWNPRKTGGGRETRVFGHDRQGAGANAETGITGLAILAYLAAGHSHLEGPYRKNVQRGLEYLLGAQRSDGDLAGDARLFARMYCHSMAMLAISEALALTGDNRIKPYVEKAVDFSVKAQNKTDGGWRYRPGDLGDMSQLGWQVMSLKSAQLGGVDVPQSTIDGMVQFLDSVSTGQHRGLAAYRKHNKPSRTMTAEALACRYFLKQSIPAATVREGTDMIGEGLPGPDQVNYYYWYYGTLAMYHTGGTAWKRWNDRMQPFLINSQRRDAEFNGSWDPNGLWSGYGGRVYSTAMAALCLEVYYRYLPVMQEPTYREANRRR